jgi:hypothetical protein
VDRALRRLGNRDPRYLVLAAFLAVVALAPSALPVLIGLPAVGTQGFWPAWPHSPALRAATGGS